MNMLLERKSMITGTLLLMTKSIKSKSRTAMEV